MTPREGVTVEMAAEKLWDSLQHYGMDFGSDLPLIVKALQTAREEGRVEALKNWTASTDFTPLLDLARKQGRDAALEEAASLCEGQYGDIYAKRIRKLKRGA